MGVDEMGTHLSNVHTSGEHCCFRVALVNLEVGTVWNQD